MEKSAKLSDSGKYRYFLLRRWDKSKGKCLFIMLNPSIADDKIEDPTLRRCISYAKKLGYGSVSIVNLFSYITPKKSELKTVNNPIGSDNDKHILDSAKETDKIICAWGNFGSYLHRSQVVVKLLRENGFSLFCLKLSKKGEPCHPLYLRKDTPLIEFVIN